MVSDAIITAGIFAIAQIGAAKLLVTNLMSDVRSTKETTQNHTVLLATTAEILGTIQNEVKRNSDNQKELFDSRNTHKDNLTRINTLHRLKGCEEMIERNRNRASTGRDLP